MAQNAEQQTDHEEVEVAQICHVVRGDLRQLGHPKQRQAQGRSGDGHAQRGTKQGAELAAAQQRQPGQVRGEGQRSEQAHLAQPLDGGDQHVARQLPVGRAALGFSRVPDAQVEALGLGLDEQVVTLELRKLSFGIGRARRIRLGRHPCSIVQPEPCQGTKCRHHAATGGNYALSMSPAAKTLRSKTTRTAVSSRPKSSAAASTPDKSPCLA